jgi:signal transduction histidine kinase
LKRSTESVTGSKPSRRLSLRVKLFLAILVVTLACVLCFALLSNYLVRRQFEHAFNEMPSLQPPPQPPGGLPPEWEHARDERIDVVNYSYIFTGLLGALLAFMLSWYLSSRISRPISKLTTATRSIAGGRYGERVDVGGTQELQELETAFNTLSEGLAHNETLRKNMIADISHELRTPLTAQRGYLEALEDGVIEPDRKVVEVLMRNNLQLTRLVEDLRQLSLVDAGQLELYPESLEVGGVLHDAAASFERAFDGKGVSLELDVVPDLAPVRADRGRVSQVLGNLLANAYLYTPEGDSITLGARPGEGEAVIFVSDNGPGIEAEELPHVFERFYRTDHSRTRGTGGSGLGLSIARGLVEAQAGRIWAESEPGHGATIFFTLPNA